MWSALGLLFAAVPPAAWWLLARTRQTGPVVAVALAAAAGALLAVQHGWTPVGRADAHLLYALVAVVLIVGGVLLERQQEGPGRDRWIRRRRAATGLLAAQLAVTLLGSLLYVLTTAEPSGPPSARDVPQLPPGLVELSQQTGCGTGNCFRLVVVGSTTGLSPAETARALGRPKETCRPNGLLLDRRKLCVGVRATEERVVLYVTLSGLLD
ncbi:MFS transporter [Kitasatospora sp. NPDC048540]|uniref:MFS transporter n=1 Tax=Kitasatospora sp. NPDC048540 TaxID=3155634 RepID=UPI0033DF9B9A